MISCKQIEGVDFFDTYSLVSKVTTIRVLIALACVFNLEIHQMDVKTTFLNGELEEEIYMSQPEGFVELGKEKKVCKLVKFLNGLKQAPKQWHKKFDQVVLSFGFQINNIDKCVYVKQFDDSGCVILCLYVDDILIFDSNMHFINDVKSFLSSNFDIKDIGLVDVILDIKLIKKNDDMVLTQSHYVEKLLKKFNYFDVKHVSTSYDSSIKLKKSLSKGIFSHKYPQIIGSLLHLTNFSGSDIAYAVGRLGCN